MTLFKGIAKGNVDLHGNVLSSYDNCLIYMCVIIGLILSHFCRIDLEIPDYRDSDDYIEVIDYPLRFKRETKSFIPLSIRSSSKPKIVDECCKKPCYLSELRSYCPE